MTAAILSWDVTPILVLYNRSGLAHNYHLCQFLRLEGAKSSSYRVTGDLISKKHLEIRYKKDFTTVTNYMISFVAKTSCREDAIFDLWVWVVYLCKKCHKNTRSHVSLVVILPFSLPLAAAPNSSKNCIERLFFSTQYSSFLAFHIGWKSNQNYLIWNQKQPKFKIAPLESIFDYWP